MNAIRNSLLWKLVLAFLVVAVTTAALVSVFIRMTSVDRLTSLVIDQQRSSLQSSLTDYYTQTGSWSGVSIDWQFLRSKSSGIVIQPTVQPNFYGYNLNPGLRDRRRIFGLADETGRVIVPVDPVYRQGTLLPSDVLRSNGTPITVNGKVVGTILTSSFTPGFNPEENLFLQRTNDALLFAVMGAMLVALVIGLLLARTLIRPLKALTNAAQNIAQGQLDQQVEVRSADEIGQLAESFNSMSREVARVNQLRRQMTADIAHDLRTPLTVIAGYVESMRDGVLQPTEGRLSLIYTEIERLQNLVGDLKMLSLADSGELTLHPRLSDPKNLLEDAAATFQHKADQQGVRLWVDAQQDGPMIKVDELRMMQVFGNLLSNSLRYTPEGGEIRLSAREQEGMLKLAVQDTGEGIAEEELPYIFNRFHRADKSRHTETGESGLGLAIVKALVEAQGGTVQAVSEPGAGTTIEIIFPIAEGERLAHEEPLNTHRVDIEGTLK